MVIIAGLAQRQNAMSDKRLVQFIQFGTELVIYQVDDLTWWYKELSPSPRPSRGYEKRETHGPFSSPEAAARDAATHLELGGIMRGGPLVTTPDSDAGRAEQALQDAMLERARAR